MITFKKIIPASTKIYKHFKTCCKVNRVLPCGVQPVFSDKMQPLGFAVLPEKLAGQYITWIVGADAD